MNPDVLIIGGGVIGVSAAYALAREGVAATVIEQGEICAGSSFGNAGLICPCHSTPIPGPGVLVQGLKWMLDPESPFYIRPRFDPALFGWLWRFGRFCTVEARERAIPLFRDLQRASLALYQEWITAEGLDCHFERAGGLELFLTREKFAHGAHEVEIMRRFGLQMALLDGDEVRALEPAVRPEVIGGIHYQEDAHLDPALLVNGLAAAAEKHGATLLPHTQALGFEHRGGESIAVHTSQGDFHPEQVVLAAGAWSAEVARGLGLSFPLQPARGYSLTMPRPERAPRIPLHLAEARMAVTSMGPHLRLAGTLELAGLGAPLNLRRAYALRRGAARYLVETGSEAEQVVWAGMRPVAPDGLPYLGRVRAVPNLIVATGHAMMGVSMGAVTGQLVAEIVQARPPSFPLEAFRVERFG